MLIGGVRVHIAVGMTDMRKAIVWEKAQQFWVHVTAEKPELIFGGDAVCLFFLLSGFGLTLSYSSKDKKRDWASYVKRRVRRIMVPYWAATALILLLDYLLLQRTYSWYDLLRSKLA